MSVETSGELSEPRVYPGYRGAGQLRAFPKGVSGNPGGWNQSAYFEARKTCAEYSPAAIKRQIELMKSDDERVAFMACEAILNRGIGKPRDHSAEESAKTQVDLSALSDDERASLAMMLSKVLGFK